MATTQNYNYNPSSAGGIVTNDAKTISDTIAAMQKQAISSATPVAQVAENARLAGTLTPTQSETLKSADYQTRVPTPVIVSSTPIAAQNNANLLEANDLIKKFSLPLAPFQTPANPITPGMPQESAQGFQTQQDGVSTVVPQTSINDTEARRLFGKDMTGVKYDPNTGTYTPDDSALARIGMTREQFANTSGTGSTNTTGGLAVNTELQKSMNALNARTAQYDQQMQDIRSGKFMNQADQAQLDAIQQSLDRQKREQSKLNSATEAAVQQGGIRSGRSRYMSEEQDMILGSAISQGQQKLSDIEARGFALLTQTKQALQDKEMKQLDDSLIAFKDNEKEKQDVIQKMYENVHAIEKEQLAQKNLEQKDALAQLKLDQQEKEKKTKDSLPLIASSVVTLDAGGKVIAPTPEQTHQFALDHGLDETLLQGAINERIEKLKVDASNLSSKETAKTKSELQIEKLRGKLGGTRSSGSFQNSEKSALSSMNTQLGRVVGSDGFIAPDNYTKARNAWIKAGFSPTMFDTKFRGFRNPNNPYYVVSKQ